MSARNMAKRTAAGTLALAVCLGGGALALAGAAQADANFKFDTRVAGDDRYATAVAASKAAFPTDGKTENVVLVNGFATVDGLTASYLAGVANAPILYVSDKGADDATKAEIKRLGAKNVWLVGGTTVIPTSVETAIKGDGYSVTRINGSDRYETAKLIAEAGAKISGKQPSKVFVASGTSFADALAVSPVAYAKGYAIALTEKDSTSDFTKKELGNIGTDNKILVGGTAVVSDKVKADLSITTRVAGDDRAVTANLVSDWAKKSEGFSVANAALVGGTNGNGADSLVASALLGKSSTTLHFAGWDATNVYLKDHALELTGKGFVFGGKAAVPGDQVDKAQAAAQSVVSNQSITVTPGDAQTLGFDKVRQYSAKGLNSDKTYRVTLVKASNITEKDGRITFLQDGTSGLAAAGTVAADLTVVNGVSVAAAQSVGAIKATDGVINFTVTTDASAIESLVPVIYVDGGANTRLELDDKQAPKETFGLGGKITTVPVEATAGTLAADLEVYQVDKKAGTFIAGPIGAGINGTGSRVYVLKSNDSYKMVTSPNVSNADLASVPTTAANFLTQLSVGDQINQGSIYSASKSPNGSVFELEDLTPALVAGVSATEQSASSVRVTWTAATQAPDEYNVYRVALTESASIPTDLADYTKIASVKGDANPLRFDDNMVSATSRYAYVVTASIDGDESGISSSDDATTPAAGVKTYPTLLDATATVDGGFIGEFSAGDTWRLVFDKPMTTIGAGDVIRVKDADGDIKNIDLGATGVSVTANANPQAIAGVTYGPNQVISIALGSTYVDPTADGASENRLSYPLTITAQSGIESNSVGWKVEESADKTVNVNTDAAAATAAPYLSGAALTTDDASADTNWSKVGDVMTLTYSENVSLNGLAVGQELTQAQVRALTGTAVAFATGSKVTVTSASSANVVLTISGAALTTGIANAAPVPGTANNLVRDADNNSADVAGTATTL